MYFPQLFLVTYCPGINPVLHQTLFKKDQYFLIYRYEVSAHAMKIMLICLFVMLHFKLMSNLLDNLILKTVSAWLLPDISFHVSTCISGYFSSDIFFFLIPIEKRVVVLVLLISLDPFMWSLKTRFDWTHLHRTVSSPILKLVPAVSVTFTSRSSWHKSYASEQGGWFGPESWVFQMMP